MLFEWRLGIASKITPKAPVEGSRRIRSNRNCSLLVPFAAQVIHNALANALISDNVDLDWWLPWWQQGKGRWGWRRQAGDVILLTTEPSDLFTTVLSHGSLGSHALLNDSYLCTWRGVFLGFPTICRPYSVNLSLPLISYISFYQDVIRHLPQPGVNSTFKHQAPSILLKLNMYARGKYFVLIHTS